MDPFVIHPIVHGGPTDPYDPKRKMDGQKLGFFVANLAEEHGHDDKTSTFRR